MTGILAKTVLMSYYKQGTVQLYLRAEYCGLATSQVVATNNFCVEGDSFQPLFRNLMNMQQFFTTQQPTCCCSPASCLPVNTVAARASYICTYTHIRTITECNTVTMTTSTLVVIVNCCTDSGLALYTFDMTGTVDSTCI